MRSGSGRGKGYNLLEAILAAFILVLVVAYSATVWMAHNRAIGKARYDMLGLFLAGKILEECIDLGVEGQREELAGQIIPLQSKIHGIDSVVDYTWYVYVNPPPGTALGSPPVRSVQVRVTWKDPNGTAREVKVETLLAGTP